MERESAVTADGMDNIEMAGAIDRYVRGERARAMLKRRLIDEICFEPLAEEFDLSVTHAKRIIYKAQAQLFSGLERREK